MKNVATMFVFVIAVFMTGCVATVKGKVSTTPPAPEPKALSDQEPVILYDCVINTETPDGNKLFTTWCPAAKENVHLPRLLLQAAEFENFSAEGVEPFSRGDKDRNYILIYYFEEDLGNGNVTFIRHQWVKNDSNDQKASKEKLVKREVTIQKDSDENWLKFYRRAFAFAMNESATVPEPKNTHSTGKPKPKDDVKPTTSPPLTIFTKQDCPGCKQAKDWLKDQKIEFAEKDIDSDKDAKKYLEEKLQMQKYPIPILEINGRLLVDGNLGVEKIQSIMALPTPDDKSPVDKPYFLLLLNAYRKSKNLQEVAYNDKLDAAALKWAEYLRDDNLKNLLHNHKGSTPAKRVKEAGYDYKVVAENLSRLVSLHMSVLLNAWQLSDGHNKNLLKKEVTEIGLDCVEAQVSENFGKYVCVLVLASQRERKARLVDAEE